MKQLILTRGFPASGKTTWAKKWVASSPETRARVCRDDLRQALYGMDAPLPRELERGVTAAEQASVRALLACGRSVVVDAMHLRRSYITEWEKLAHEVGADFDVQEFFDDPVDVLIARDREREAQGERSVGEEFIRETSKRYAKIELFSPSVNASPETYTYEPDPNLPPTWMVDLDGTLALMDGRSPFEWERVGEDKVNSMVAHIIDALFEQKYNIVLMSGRDGVCRPHTMEWLSHNQIEYDELFMRTEGDTRKDSIVKLEMFREHVAPKYCVYGVLDDRDQVVEMWRSIGLFCAQVAPGAF